MTIINGASHHNVEDILASIRTSIAEEGTSARSVSVEIHSPNARRESFMAEEAADFELPAIFKPGHQTVPERQRLLGRLSDALKTSNAAEAGRRTVIPFEPAAARTFEPQAPVAMAQSIDRGNHRQGLPAQQVRREQTAEPTPEPQEVKRVMTTFFDTRISRLGEMSRQAAMPEPKPEPVAVAPPPAPEPPVLPVQRYQPMLPEGNLAHVSNGGVEDAAAQLLRPMLRQWLTENMPKIVEKALRSEAGEDPRPGPRKPGI